MDRKQMPYEEFAQLLLARLPEVRQADPDRQVTLTESAWRMVQGDVPWPVALAATRLSALQGAGGQGVPGLVVEVDASAGRGNAAVERPDPLLSLDPGDLSHEAPPPLRREVGRHERERLSANTRQTIRMARQARRWHEIRKMRSVLLNIDQGYLKRMLGSESDALNQEINSLLRSWAPLIREHQQGGRPMRRRR